MDSRPIVLETPGSDPATAALFERGRDALLALVPGMRSLLTHVRVVADADLPDGHIAEFGVRAREGVDEDEGTIADVQGVLTLSELTFALLTTGLLPGVDAATTSADTRGAGQRTAAIAVLHELIHSISWLDPEQQLSDWVAAQGDPLRLLFREAVTQLAADHFADRWFAASGIGPVDAPTVPSKISHLDASGVLETRLITYITAESLVSQLLDTIADNAELREVWIDDLLGGAHETSVERLADGLVAARNPDADPAAVTAGILVALREARSDFCRVRTATAAAADAAWEPLRDAMPIRSTLRRTTTPVAVDVAATEAMRKACTAVAAHAVRHVDRALGE